MLKDLRVESSTNRYVYHLIGQFKVYTSFKEPKTIMINDSHTTQIFASCKVKLKFTSRWMLPLNIMFVLIP